MIVRPLRRHRHRAPRRPVRIAVHVVVSLLSALIVLALGAGTIAEDQRPGAVAEWLHSIDDARP